MVGMKILSLFLLDVKNTFLDDDLEEDIYMKQHFEFVARERGIWPENITSSMIPSIQKISTTI